MNNREEFEGIESAITQLGEDKVLQMLNDRFYLELNVYVRQSLKGDGLDSSKAAREEVQKLMHEWRPKFIQKINENRHSDKPFRLTKEDGV